MARGEKKGKLILEVEVWRKREMKGRTERGRKPVYLKNYQLARARRGS